MKRRLPRIELADLAKVVCERKAREGGGQEKGVGEREGRESECVCERDRGRGGESGIEGRESCSGEPRATEGTGGFET